MTPRQMDGLALIDLRGSLAAGAATERVGLAAAIARLADAGIVDIALNLADVTRVDARGLGELLLALRAAHDRGAHLTLVDPPPRLRRMLAITRLDTVFDMTESCGSFGPLGWFGSFEGSERSEGSGVQLPIPRSSSNQLSTT
jgi:anti-anti-sigma factor